MKKTMIRLGLVIAAAVFAGSAQASYAKFADDAMSLASGFTGGSVSSRSMTVTDATKLVYVPGGSNDSLNRKERGWYAGVTIEWPEGGARDDDAKMQTSRMSSPVAGDGNLSGTTLTITKEHARSHTCMATTTWWGYITPEEAYAKKTGTFGTTLTMSGDNYGWTTYGVKEATFAINFPVDGLVLKDDQGVQCYPIVATNAAGKIYGDLNVALKAGGTVCSVADAAITEAITLEDGIVFRKGAYTIDGLANLTLNGGSYDFNPSGVCTLGEGRVVEQQGDLWVVKTCSHEWSFEVNPAGDTFTATCSKGCSYTPQTVSITITPESKTFDGQELTAALTYNTSKDELEAQTGATVGEIVWTGDKKSAGDHTATVTIKAGGVDYVISNTVTIAPAGMSTASVTLKATEVLFTGIEQTNAIESVTSAAGIDENDWEIVDKTALYGAGSGYSNVTYTVTLQGKRNYTGTTTVTWTVKAPTREFDSDAMGRGDYDVSSKLYNENYGEAVGRELVVTATTNIIFVKGYWWVGMTVELPTDINVLSPSTSSLTDDDNLRVTLSTTGKTYTGTQIYNKQVTDAMFQIVDGDHDSQWWAGIGTFQYFKTLRWFTPVSPAMIEEALGNGGGDLEFTMTVGGITGRWEGLKYTDFTIKVPVHNFIFKVRENESADIGNVSFTATKILLKAGSVVTNACAIDYTLEKNVYTDVAGHDIVERKVSDTCWVYASETVANVTIPNVANQASKVVTLDGSEVSPIDSDKTLYRVHEGDTLVITYTAEAGYVPATAERTMANVAPGATLTDLPVFTWPTARAEPEELDGAVAHVFTNGVEIAYPYAVASNEYAYVWYVADEHHIFADGTISNKTGEVKINANPTVIPAIQDPELKAAVSVEPQSVDHTEFKVTYTNVVQETVPFRAFSNDTVKVTYTVSNGWFFAGGETTYETTYKADKDPALVPEEQLPKVAAAVAKIGTDAYYYTLAKAVNAAQDGETVTILTNIDLAAYQEIPKTLAIELNGFTVAHTNATFKDDGQVLVVNGYGNTVTVRDSSVAKTGKITGGTGNNGGALVVASGTLNLEGGVYSNNKASFAGGVAYVNNGGTLNVNGGCFVENYAAGAMSLFATQSAAATCSVSNGWFDVDPWQYAAPGRASVYIAESNLWTMADAVCKIDEHRYFSISNAIENAEASDIIELVADTEEDVVLGTLGQYFNFATNTFAFTGTVTTTIEGAIVHVEPQQGYTTYRVMMPVAKIGEDKKFAYLHEAFAAADDGETVTLIAGCSNETSYAVANAITLDENGFEATNVCIAATGTVAIKGATGSANKLRTDRPTLFGTLENGAKAVTDKTYVYVAAFDAFYEAGHEVVATTYSAYGEYLESYPKFADGLKAVTTNGTIYALTNITNDGFTVAYNMTIDLATAADGGVAYSLTIDSPARKTVGIEIGRQVSDVTFRGGTVSAGANAGITTFVSSSAKNLTLDNVMIDGGEMLNDASVATKTLYALALNEGATTLTNAFVALPCAAKAYALYVSCYGASTGNTVTFLDTNQLKGNILVNAQNDAPVKVAFGRVFTDTTYALTVNKYNSKTAITKAWGSEYPIELTQPEFCWNRNYDIDELAFGKVQIVGEEDYYSTLAEAMEEVGSGQTIRLCADVVEEAGVEAPVGMTLDLNGHTLTIKGGTGDFTVDDVTVKIVGTNENSRIVGDVWATDYYGNSTCLSICGGTYIGQVAAYGSSVLNIADAIVTLEGVNEPALQLGSYGDEEYGSAHDDQMRVAVVNSRITGYSAAYLCGGSLAVSNSVLTAFGSEKMSIDRDNWMGGTGDALVIDQVPGYPISVTLEAGTKLQQQLDIGCEQLGWYTNAQGTVTATVKKRAGVDALAVDGYYWAGDVGGMLTMTTEPVPPVPTIPVPMMIAKNTLNLAPAFTAKGLDPDAKVNVGGEEVTVRPEDLTITVGAAADEVSFKSIPDFTYELLATDKIGGEYEVVDRVRATTAETTLTATKAGQTARFYKVRLVK